MIEIFILFFRVHTQKIANSYYIIIHIQLYIIYKYYMTSYAYNNYMYGGNFSKYFIFSCTKKY